MPLTKEEVQGFFATVQAFVDALPPSPKRERLDATQTGGPQHANLNQTKRHNAITLLRFEVLELAGVFTKDRALYDLSDDAFDKASDALEELFHLLNGLVDDGITSKELWTGPPPRFPKLQALETLLRPYTQVPTIDGSIRFPKEILTWIKYPAEGAEPLQYRMIAKRVQDFNNTMRGIYEAHMAGVEPELTQVEATRIFHQTRQPQEDTSDDQKAEADVQQAQKLCDFTKALAKVFTKGPKACQPPHSAHIHLSGFEEDEIDMLVSVCGETKSKWHIVHWANPSSPAPRDQQQNPTASICSILKESRTFKTRLRIQLQQDGCWNGDPPRPNDRIPKYAVAPKKTLDEWLSPKKDGEANQTTSSELTRKNKLRIALKVARSLLCLLGSPLLQGPWKSQSILIAEIADGSSDQDLKIKPYISGLLTECLDEIEFKQSERAKSSILHLGILFWELFFEEKVTITEEDKDEDEDEDEDEDKDETKSLYNALNRKEIYSRQSSFINMFCLDLIANCLNLYPQAGVIDTTFRRKMYWDIIKPLITSFEDCSSYNKKLATTVHGRPAPPLPSHSIWSKNSFGQQQASNMKLVSMKKPNRPALAHGNRLQHSSPASPLSTVTAAGEDYQVGTYSSTCASITLTSAQIPVKKYQLNEVDRINDHVDGVRPAPPIQHNRPVNSCTPAAGSVNDEAETNFTIAIVCVLPLEYSALAEILDEKPRVLQHDNDRFIYTTGVLAGQKVVIAYPPDVGLCDASLAVQFLEKKYGNMELIILLGICAGVPTAPGRERPIYLADVIIGTDMLAYAHSARKNSARLELRKILPEKAGNKIRQILHLLGTEAFAGDLEERSRRRLSQLGKENSHYRLRLVEEDLFFDPSYHHLHRSQCPCNECDSNEPHICQDAEKTSCEELQCDRRHLVRHRPSYETTPLRIHFGVYASADMIMRDAEVRDDLATNHKVIAFDMEAAGIWGLSPHVVVIKGVSDYGDSHKTKQWQPLAAAHAACTAKAFVEMFFSRS